jgi:hypothetical protein
MATTHVVSVNEATADSNTGDVQIPIFKRKTILTDAQIKALPTTPVELVPAPGAGKILIFQGAVYHKKAMAAAYTGIQPYDGIYIAIGTSQGVEGGFWDDPDSSLADFTELLGTSPSTDYFYHSLPLISMVGNYQRARQISFDNNGVNQPFRLIWGGGGSDPLTGGDASNTMEVTVFYSIVDL